MKTELQKQLLAKYPEFFSHEKKKIYVGEKSMKEEVGELLKQKEIVTPIQFGFSCGDGWYMLLDQLMAEIQNHLENENRTRQNTLVPIFWKLQYWFRRYKRTRFIGDWIYYNAPRKKYVSLTLSVTQIKEKFGGLCFYYHGGDDTISGMVYLAESMSYKICESCGTTINVGQTQGWIYTVCSECREKNERIKERPWKLNER